MATGIESLVIVFFFFFVCFFFSSRRRHTRLVSDWSSDVCSSDLFQPVEFGKFAVVIGLAAMLSLWLVTQRKLSERRPGLGYLAISVVVGLALRSEERRVGKECRSRWSPYH